MDFYTSNYRLQQWIVALRSDEWQDRKLEGKFHKRIEGRDCFCALGLAHYLNTGVTSDILTTRYQWKYVDALGLHGGVQGEARQGSHFPTLMSLNDDYGLTFREIGELIALNPAVWLENFPHRPTRFPKNRSPKMERLYQIIMDREMAEVHFVEGQPATNSREGVQNG